MTFPDDSPKLGGLVLHRDLKSKDKEHDFLAVKVNRQRIGNAFEIRY